MPGKILLVEDDELNRKLFVSILTERGFDVVEAVDGEEAVSKIETESPSVVLLDLIIPKIDGLNVFKICKEKGLLENKRVYALTAAPMNELLDEGFNGIITKPIRIMDFIEAVEKAFQ